MTDEQRRQQQLNNIELSIKLILVDIRQMNNLINLLVMERHLKESKEKEK